MGGGEEEGVPAAGIANGATSLDPEVFRDLGDFLVAAVRFEPGWRSAKQRHGGGHVMVTVSGRICTRFPDGSWHADSGDVLVHGAGLVHEHVAGPAGAEAVAVCVREGSATIRSLPRLFQVQGVVPASAALPTARRILRELTRRQSHADLVLRSLTLQLLTSTARAAEKDTGQNGHQPPAWLQEARAVLEEGFHEPIRIGALADELGLTSMQLIRTFQKHFGTSPGAYLRQVRLEHALALLAESTEPLTAVALGSGYSDQSHLCRVIKEETGLTPGEYRRSFHNG